MRLPRYSLAGLMVAVLLAGVGLAGLRFASPLWASAAHTALLGLLLASLLAICLRTGRARAGWLGFAIFGWGYLLFGFTSWLGGGATPPPLVTVSLFDSLHQRLFPAPVAVDFGWVEQIQATQAAAGSQPYNVVVSNPTQNPNPAAMGWTSSTQARPFVLVDDVNRPTSTIGSATWIAKLANVGAPSPDLVSFRQVGHCLAALVAALLGAFVGRIMLASTPREEPSSPPQSHATPSNAENPA